MIISKDFPGGNIEVVSIEGDSARLANELRDTTSDWFYWAFRVRGAAGRTVTFDFSPKPGIGYWGPAVSHDLKAWAWGGAVSEDRMSFTYAFGPDEDDVYFCHDLLYSADRFTRFAASHGLKVGALCVSGRGVEQPLAELGEGDEVLFLTSRHHACESTGTYVMEGILSEFSERPLPGMKVLAAPFMDMDGVMAGDQGKSRGPHDHNRDYTESPLYPSVRAVKALAERENVTYMFDLHSPWHLGNENDTPFLVRKNIDLRPAEVRFGELFEAECRRDPAAFQYRTEHDIDVNIGWNQDSKISSSCAGFFSHRPGMRLCCTLETAYFGQPGNVASQDGLLRLGRCMARAIRAARDEGI